MLSQKFHCQIWRTKPRPVVNTRIQTCRCQAGPVRMQGAYYEDIVDQLAHKTLAGASRPASKNKKYIVGIAGAPGSGKSTLSHLVVGRINDMVGSEVAALLPMDGFHYYRKELDAMPDPKVAEEGHALAPSFDHGVGDPVPEDISITHDHKIVVVEGNYVLLDLHPWDQLQALFDDTWFVEVGLDEAMDRVYRRQTGHGMDSRVSRTRIATNDRPNGELIDSSKKNAQVIVPSSIPFQRALRAEQ